MIQTHLDQLKSKVIPILKSAGVTRSSIFGSMARGDDRNDIDIDILIDFPKEKVFLILLS